ncbi:hypothetical protein MUK42_02232 [Musa troglodytarum]|uniref:Uncharacterized protein n=1 Tax=Musa troglodytarum TaxID=320322 RepID=A0A9E7EV98_9LILI|nr:hypothetical protein MUK42_02232 [Musa troglodytarum]
MEPTSDRQAKIAWNPHIVTPTPQYLAISSHIQNPHFSCSLLDVYVVYKYMNIYQSIL